MRFLRRFFRRAGNFIMRRRNDERLREEIESHLALQTQVNIQAGMAPDEARRQAALKFGAAEAMKQDYRAELGLPFIESVLQDVRFGLRMLRKSPGFTLVAILTLALGIGANTAIFSLINAVMLRTLPVPNPQQLVILGWAARGRPSGGGSWSSDCPFTGPGSQPDSCSFSYPLFEHLRAEQKSFSGLFAYAPGGWYVFVSGGFFSTLEVRPAIGRLLTSADNTLGAPPVAVLSYRYWQSHYGGSRSVVGKAMDIGKVPFTIVGVASSRFTGISPGSIPDVWLPLSPSFGTDIGFPKERQTDPRNIWIEMMARLRPGVSIARAQALTNAMFVRDVTSGSQALFRTNAEPRLLLSSFARGTDDLRLEYSQSLVLLLVLTGIVLLLACANVAGLALARSAARQKEVAVRLALGTTRRRLIRQLLTESLLLAVAGGAAGILLAYWGASFLVAYLSANQYSHILIDVHPELRVLVFLVLLSTLAGIFAGLAPAVRATRVDPGPALKEASTAQAGEKRSWHRLGAGSGLAVAQVALSVLVLAAAGLLVRSLLNQESGHAGFQVRNLLTVPLASNGGSFFMGRAPADPQRVALLSQLRERISSLPGVVSATYASNPPMSGDSGWVSYTVDGQPPEPGSRLRVSSFAVGPDFFKALEIPLVEGDGFTAADFNSDAKIAPLIVSRGLVRQAFGKENPLGHKLAFNGPPGRIVGVVPDISYDSPPDGSPLQPRLYYPLTGGPAFFEIRTAGDPKALIPEIREVTSRSNSGLEMTAATTVSDRIDKLLYRERLIGWLSSLFALLALALACIGLYGLLAWEVARQTREIGIRMALGAERGAVLRMVLRRGAKLAFVGTVAGVALALGLTRLLDHFLFAVSATDPVSFAAVACLLLAVALAACYFPARRAMRIDPMSALRNE